MIFILDNYDSFTYNLVQYIGSLTPDLVIKRNNTITLEGVKALKPKGIIISPGPKSPKDAGISVSLVQEYAGKVPILGVCLGHQSIGYAFGASIVRCSEFMHGKTSQVYYEEGSSIFKGLSNPFVATRYHSLVIDPNTLADDIMRITARTDNGIIMGIEGRKYAHLYGVQFHPESIYSPEGMQIVKNFYSIVKSL